MKYLPIEVETAFKKHFSFPDGFLFGSVATINENRPRTRTMRIYALNREGCPILLTHTRSNKWNEFVQHPYVSINCVSENKLMQILVSGTLQLATPHSAPEDAKAYWECVRADVKKIYDPRHAIEEIYTEIEDLAIPQEVPPTFGIAIVIPSFWEILDLNAEYTKSCRIQFHLEKGTWQQKRIHVG